MKNAVSFIRARIRSFAYAFAGMGILLREEHNVWIHLTAAICAIAGGLLLEVSGYEWIAIVFAIGFVIALEIVNTIIENIADFISPGKNKSIKKIKDLSAAGVLISSIASLIVGLLIFLPKIFGHA